MPASDALGELKTLVGRTYVWEPLSPYAYSRTKVVDVQFNGEEHWVTTEDANGSRHMNELSRFLEAISYDEEGEPE